MDKLSNPILYSTMTLVAYNINIRYYSHQHYMWCTPYFGSNYDSPHFTVPPSSSPLEIYSTIEKEIASGQLHSGKIKLNRLGIRRGADKMLALGRISADEHKDIHTVSRLTPIHMFRPLLCIIPRLEAVNYHSKVPVRDRANPLAYEYIVADLPQSAFDVIRIGK